MENFKVSCFYKFIHFICVETRTNLVKVIPTSISKDLLRFYGKYTRGGGTGGATWALAPNFFWRGLALPT